MFESFSTWPKLALDPMERISETLFALIMVLTFTCSFSVAGAGREEVRELLIGALGCNVAWGIIDAAFYLMGSFSLRGQGILKLRALTQASSPADAPVDASSRGRATTSPKRPRIYILHPAPGTLCPAPKGA